MEKRRYTDEEKQQLIANLDIEGMFWHTALQCGRFDEEIHSVAHRNRQLKAELEIKLETFGLHQLAQISRIPKQIRNMTMRDFGEKYEGNLQSALRGYQKEKLAAAGIDASKGEIDKDERKRKWVASQEVDIDISGSKDSEPPRSFKNGVVLCFRLSSILLIPCIQLEHNHHRPRKQGPPLILALLNDHVYYQPLQKHQIQCV